MAPASHETSKGTCANLPLGVQLSNFKVISSSPASRGGGHEWRTFRISTPFRSCARLLIALSHRDGNIGEQRDSDEDLAQSRNLLEEQNARELDEALANLGSIRGKWTHKEKGDTPDVSVSCG